MFMRRRRRAVTVIAVSVLLAACGGGADQGAPEVTSTEQLVAEGENLYRSMCAQCHGIDLDGTGAGPPLLHPLYAPGTYSDEAFAAAVVGGVAPKHWEFGAMPMQAVRDEDVRAITAYVRSVQRAEGTDR